MLIHCRDGCPPGYAKPPILARRGSLPARTEPYLRVELAVCRKKMLMVRRDAMLNGLEVLVLKTYTDQTLQRLIGRSADGLQHQRALP